MSFDELVIDHREQFGTRDTIRVLTRLHGYTVDEARALIKRLRDGRKPQEEVTR